MRAAATITAAALAVASTLVGVQLAASGPARADEVTISQNVSRNGWDSHEPALSPTAVAGKAFGQVFDTPVNGQVYAQPLNVGNSVLVATENDYVYSINRNTGRVIWSRQLGSPYASAAENCLQTPVVQPYIGVTSAPVYDPKTGTLYVSGMLSGPPGDDTHLSTATPTYDLFALNEQTGAIKWKKRIAGSPTNNSSNKFNAALQMQRTGLLLLNGSVYMGFGALCADGGPTHQYVGYVAGVNSKTHAETLWTDQKGPAATGEYGGIWQGGGGLVTDGKSIYFSTANGMAPRLGTKGSAAAGVRHLGQSMVKLNVETNGSLRPADFFSPGDADVMSALDHDFGSGGPILLPFGTEKYPHLFATADKQAQLYLINAANLGGRSSSATGSTAVFTGSPSMVGETTVNGTDHGLWGHMAAFAGVAPNGSRADYLYYEGTGWGSQAPMYALKFVRASPSRPVLRRIAATTQPFGFTSGSPVITSNGRADTSAVVWEVHANTQTGSGGALDAYSALPSAGGVLPLIWSAPIGDASQFSVPATSGGRIYVGARNDASAAAADNATSCPTNFESARYTATDSACVGDVYEFGIFSAHLAAFTLHLGNLALGQTRTKTVTLTNTGDIPVTITKVTRLSAPFRIPTGPPLNKPIARGASVRFPVTFTPRATGTAIRKFLATTTDGFTTHTTTVTVRGVGVAPARTTVSSLGKGGALLGFGLFGVAVVLGAQKSR